MLTTKLPVAHAIGFKTSRDVISCNPVPGRYEADIPLVNVIRPKLTFPSRTSTRVSESDWSTWKRVPRTVTGSPGKRIW